MKCIFCKTADMVCPPVSVWYRNICGCEHFAYSSADVFYIHIPISKLNLPQQKNPTLNNMANIINRIFKLTNFK